MGQEFKGTDPVTKVILERSPERLGQQKWPKVVATVLQKVGTRAR